MNEIKLLVEEKAGQINFNYEETKGFLQDKMSEYEGAVFTDESMVYAKKERAFLRSLKSKMDEERKNVKRAWMVPYNNFEAQVKELLELVDGPVQLIDSQVKAYEERKKAEKRALCQEIYDALVGELRDILPFEKIVNEKWLNASTSKKSIEEDIAGIINSTQSDIDTIKSTKSDAVDDALQIYYKTLDLSQAITHINQYETTKREIEERDGIRREREAEEKLEAERERTRQEERKRIQEEQEAERKKAEELEQARQEAAEKAKKEVISSMVPEDVGTENLSLYEYRMELSPDSKAALEMYMDSVGIEWEVIYG